MSAPDANAPDGNELAAITHAARLLQARYGEDGAVIAIMRAAEAAALGDLELADHWEAVAAAMEDVATSPPDNLN